MDKYNLVNPYNAISSGHKKEQSTDLGSEVKDASHRGRAA